MRQLIESFVDADWVRDIDFSRAERMETSFVTNRFQERESDLIWKVPYNGEELYLYLLIEFQSKVDRFMALRVLRYVCEFYQHIVDTKRPRPTKKLPPVFPIVLYNGEAKWTAPVDIADLIDQRVGFSPRFCYYKLAENEFPPDVLTAVGNLVAALFLVETTSLSELREKSATVVAMLKREKYEEVDLFRGWLMDFFRSPPHEIVDGIDPVGEVEKVFEAKLKAYKREVFKEGKEEGKLEGKREEKIDMARKLKARGMDTLAIAEITGLAEAEVETI